MSPLVPIRLSKSIDQGLAPSFEKISACVHCGLCLEACPTYRELRVEMDSPRGRIYLMKGLFAGRIEPTPTTLKHLDQCLDCRACETACPSGVQYGNILEHTRAALAPTRTPSLPQQLLRWFFFKQLLPNRTVQAVVFGFLWIGQTLGLVHIGRWLAGTGLLPARLKAAVASAPNLPLFSFRQRAARPFNRDNHIDPQTGTIVFPARGERRHRVALFTGCIADQMFSEVNQATVEVLTHNGCEVEVLADEGCCGALHLHNGEYVHAKDLARRNVDRFKGFDRIISNAAGCSAELRHYGGLLDNDAQAATFGGAIRDICEFLVEINFERPAAARNAGKKKRLAYDEPCHLLHAQKISSAPRAVLDALPGYERVTLEAADACCGSAGVYAILQPELSSQVSRRKIDHIKASGAEVVATGNPGCLLQIAATARTEGVPIRVEHPVVLLAEAYRAAQGR